jgi:hypothetical protein
MMRTNVWNVFISVLILVGICIVLAPSDKISAQMTEEQKNIKRLVELTRVDLIVKDITIETIKKLEFSFPQVSPDVIREFMNKVDTDKAVEDILVPIYERYFSPSEIEELLRFYESPVGKKMMTVHSQIMQEAIGAGQQWGHSQAKEFIRQLDDQK